MDKDKALLQARQQVVKYKKVLKELSKLTILEDYNICVNLDTGKCSFMGDVDEVATKLYNNNNKIYELLKEV